jgi:hypothetical protein
VDTLGGRMHVRWDQSAAATPHGRLVFCAEFLATTGVFEPERVHHARHQPLPDDGAGVCAGLQLVELVLAARTTPRPAWTPSRVGPCCWQRQEERHTARARRRCTSRPCTARQGKASLLKSLIANIQVASQHVKTAAEQYKSIDRWGLMLRDLSDKIAPSLGPFRPPNGFPAAG